MESSVTVVIVTAPTHDEAERIVTAAVEERLAACGNIVQGVTSIYRWEGSLQKDSEVLILFKTTRAALPRLMSRVEELHPYDVPEALAVPITAGLEAYTDWVAANVHG
ncbi:MAG TPA: divalent-cation tolerance protein CutA [Longimicrobiales bacterium]|nr:divalent-cation tolerance protein CutA [Longimicrobiales bacterium]